MTRTDRLTEAARRAKEKLARDRKALVKIESAQLVEQKKACRKRRYEVGTLAEAAGLCGLSDADLVGLFTMLGRLTQEANPVAAMEALLGDRVCPDLVAMNGLADLRSCDPFGAS